MRRLLFAFLRAFLWLSAGAHACEVAIVFRPIAVPSHVYAHVKANPNGKWPGVERVGQQLGWPKYPSGFEASPPYKKFIDKAVYADSKSWGHTAIELSDETGTQHL